MVKEAAEKPLSNIPRRAIETERFFPLFSAWLNKRFDEQWETTEVKSEIENYGTVQWNGRPLEGIIILTNVAQENRIRGVKKTDCFTFGEVNDAEFSMERDPVEVDCASGERTIVVWKARRQFKSLWNAE